MFWNKYLRSVRFWLGICFILVIIIVRFSGLHSYITLQTFQEKRLHLLQHVTDHYIASVLVYIALYIVIVASAIPLAGLGTVIGGFLFGVVPGALYANIGATVGATIFFLLVRYAFGTMLQERYKHKLQQFNEQMHSYGEFYLIAFRFIVAVPFFIENLLLGLTKIPLWTFVWTTSLGILPGSLVYTYAGQQLTKITHLRDILSLPILIAFLLLALLALVPIAVQWYWRSRGRKL